jgi:hypothetical protein
MGDVGKEDVIVPLWSGMRSDGIASHCSINRIEIVETN